MSGKKTHFRKAFDSPYLASADIVGPTNLTIKCVKLEPDKTNKTKAVFNTAYFKEKSIRQGEPLKPMILNATNSLTVKNLTKSKTPYIDEWVNIPVTVYVDNNVEFMGAIVDGLKIKNISPKIKKDELTPGLKKQWAKAVESYKKYGDFHAIEKHMIISDKNKKLIKKEAK